MSDVLENEAKSAGFSTVNPREIHGMVYEVWGDCEVTLTKAGDLYLQRSLHQIMPPLRPGNSEGSVAFDDEEQAFKFAKHLWEGYKDYVDGLIRIYTK